MYSKGLSRVFSNTTVQKHQFFNTQPSLWSNSHKTTGKTIALTTWTFVGKVISLLFNTLSRFVIDFLPRSKCLNFMAAAPFKLILEPKNTGVGSLSLLQWIFPTQGSNWGLLHCRWILYQLSYQGSVRPLTKIY